MPASARDLVLREASPGDVDAVLALWSASRSAVAKTPDRPEAVRSLIAGQSPADLLIAELDGRLVGTVIAAWDGWRGNLYRLAVDPDVRRRGIAARLVEFGHRRLRERGARRVTALAGRGDGRATGFWSCGRIRG